MRPEQIRSQLKVVLQSETFRKSERMSRFLRYLVESKIAHGSTPKEKDIAENVFDRKVFEQKTDPIVRVEARRLRRLLAHYYEKEGAQDSIVFQLAPRGYILRYSLGGPAPAKVELPEAPTQSPSENPEELRQKLDSRVAVLPFQNLTSDRTRDSFCLGVTQEVTNALTHKETLKVVSSTSVLQFQAPQDVRELAKTLGVDVVLEGSVRTDDARVRITAQLSHASDGFQYWSDTFDAEIESGIEAEEKLALRISAAAMEHLNREEVEPSFGFERASTTSQNAAN